MRVCVWTFRGRVWGPMGAQGASNRGFLAPRGVWGLFYLLSLLSLQNLLSLLSHRKENLWFLCPNLKTRNGREGQGLLLCIWLPL